MGLFDFFRGASDYVHPDPAALDQAGETGPRHAAYHQRIVWISSACGMIGAILGIMTSVGLVQSDKSGRGVLLAPFMFGAAGLLLGAATACMFAPRAFLTGPLGQQWMKLIGTKSVLVARMVCGVWGLLIGGPLIAIVLLILFGK